MALAKPRPLARGRGSPAEAWLGRFRAWLCRGWGATFHSLAPHSRCEHFRARPQNKQATGSGCALYRCPPPAPPRPLSSRGLSLAALPSSRSSLSPLSPESLSFSALPSRGVIRPALFPTPEQRLSSHFLASARALPLLGSGRGTCARSDTRSAAARAAAATGASTFRPPRIFLPGARPLCVRRAARVC